MKAYSTPAATFGTTAAANGLYFGKTEGSALFYKGVNAGRIGPEKENETQASISNQASTSNEVLISNEV